MTTLCQITHLSSNTITTISHNMENRDKGLITIHHKQQINFRNILSGPLQLKTTQRKVLRWPAFLGKIYKYYIELKFSFFPRLQFDRVMNELSSLSLSKPFEALYETFSATFWLNSEFEQDQNLSFSYSQPVLYDNSVVKMNGCAIVY